MSAAAVLLSSARPGDAGRVKQSAAARSGSRTNDLNTTVKALNRVSAGWPSGTGPGHPAGRAIAGPEIPLRNDTRNDSSLRFVLTAPGRIVLRMPETRTYVHSSGRSGRIVEPK
jgi:hypothetical protein